MNTTNRDRPATRREFIKQLSLAGAGLAAGDHSAALTASGPARWQPKVLGGAAVDPPLAVQVLTRMGFGPRPGDVAAFNSLGGDDVSRINAYIDQQLAPEAITDTDFQNRLSAFGGTTLSKSQ